MRAHARDGVDTTTTNTGEITRLVSGKYRPIHRHTHHRLAGRRIITTEAVQNVQRAGHFKEVFSGPQAPIVQSYDVNLDITPHREGSDNGSRQKQIEKAIQS